MTEEINIRASRARRRTEGNDPVRENGMTDYPGEAAWSLDEPADELATDTRKCEEPALPPPFPMFPELDTTDQEEQSRQGLDVRRFARGVWKRRWIVVGVTGAFILVSVLLAFTLLNHKWEAVAVLVQHTHQDKFTLGSATPFKPQDYSLKTMLDTVKLPTNLDAIMRATGVSVLRRTLASAIDVAPGKDSSMFQVKVTWDDPQIATDVANQVASLLIERSRTMRRREAEDTYEYYSAQLDEARITRRGINEDMQKLQAETNATDFDTEMKVLIEELSQLEAEYNTKVAEIDAMGSARMRLEHLISEQPEMVVLSTIYRSPLKQRLTEYEWQLQEARSRYTAENPKVVKLQERISVLEKMIEESNTDGAPQNTYAPNDQLQEMQTRLQEMTDELEVRKAQSVALRETIEGMRQKLDRLSSSKKEYALIRSRLEGAESLEANLISRVDEARVIMLRNEASFDLVEAAHVPQEPLSSGRKLFVGGGIILGGGAGLFIALLLEFIDPLVRTRRDAVDIIGTELVWEFQRAPTSERALIDPHSPAQPVSTLFRRMLNEFSAHLEDDQWRKLAVTSLEPHAGRSLVAANIARALALKEQPVLLVDADLRTKTGRRSSELMGLSDEGAGLWELLQNSGEVSDLTTLVEVTGVDVLRSGDLPPRREDGTEPALDALGSRRLKKVVDNLKQPNRHLLVELPPLDAQETVLEAAAAIGNLLLVVRSGQTARAELREMVQTLQNRDVPIRAVILTDVPDELLSGKPLYETPGPPSGRRWGGLRKQTPNESIHGTPI